MFEVAFKETYSPNDSYINKTLNCMTTENDEDYKEFKENVSFLKNITPVKRYGTISYSTSKSISSNN